MVRKTVETYVEVDIGLDEFVTDELLDELESRGFSVRAADDSKHYEDHILSLKEDFINWYQFGMKNENFEKILKEFFKDTIDEHVV